MNTSNSVQRLRHYDVQTISHYYNWRPWWPILRFFQISFKFLGFFIRLWLDRLAGDSVAATTRRAIHLRKLLTSLGPGTIKIGQALSTRPDLVPQLYMNELTKLQDSLPPFDSALSCRIIEEQLRGPLTAYFSEFDRQPVAAASLGQVHKARLLTGEVVAVKVQRPNLLDNLTCDLYLLRRLALWFGPYLPLNLGFNLDSIVDEFGTKLFEEINYVQEGKNCERFARYFAGDPSVYIPKIYWQASADKVLTLEWINGIKLNDVQRIKDAGLDVSCLIRVGVEAGLKQLLEFGFFHADPHPGNLFALLDGRIAYIDFGMMDQLDDERKEFLVDALVHLLNREYESLSQDFLKLGFLAPQTDIKVIVPALEKVLGDLFGARVSQVNFKAVTDQFSDLVFDYPFRVPAQFALIIRSLITQEGVALSLDPDFQILKVAYPYVARRLLTDESPRLRQRLIEILFKNNQFQWQRLENLLTMAGTSGNEFDLVPTARLGLRYLLSPEGKSLRERLVFALTQDDRLHTRELAHLWQLLSPRLPTQNLAQNLLQEVWTVTRERLSGLPSSST